MPEDHQRRGHHGKERRERAAEPVQDEPAAHRRDDEAGRARQDRPEEPARALGRKVERQPEAEEAVGRADDPEVGGARREHLGLGAEEADPRVREERRGEPDRLGRARGHEGARPRHVPGALALTRADVGADHGDERRAEAKTSGIWRYSRRAPMP